MVRLQPDLLAAVDTFIAETKAGVAAPEEITRPEAVRRLAAEALVKMGLLKP